MNSCSDRFHLSSLSYLGFLSSVGICLLALRVEADQPSVVRNQPRVRRIQNWHDQQVVEADQYYVLDLAAAKATPLVLPGMQRILALASQGPGKALALGQDQAGTRILLQQAEMEWKKQLLPTDVASSFEPVQLCADAASTVLFSTAACFRKTGNDWQAVPVKERPAVESATGLPGHLLLVGSTLYLAYGSGEFGGALLALNLQDGSWKKIELPPQASYLPIRDLKVGPDNTVWIAAGLSQLSTSEGALCSFDGQAWKAFVATRKYLEARNLNWNLPATSLEGIAFGSDRALYALGENVGVVRHESKTWKRLTPDWPGFQRVTALDITRNGVAVIGLYDAGLLLWKLGTKECRPVSLK